MSARAWTRGSPLTPLTLTTYVMHAPYVTFTYNNVYIGLNKRRINKKHAGEIFNEKTQTNLNPNTQAGL